MNSPRDILYSASEPMLPGFSGVSIALVIAAATLVVSVLGVVVSWCRASKRDQKTAVHSGEGVMPYDVLSAFVWCALSALSLHFVVVAELRFRSLESDSLLLVMGVLFYIALVLCAVMAVLSIMASPSRPASILAGLVGAAYGFGASFLLICVQKRASILASAPLDVGIQLTLALAVCLAVSYAVCWLVWLVGWMVAGSGVDGFSKWRHVDDDPAEEEAFLAFRESALLYGRLPLRAVFRWGRDLISPLRNVIARSVCVALAVTGLALAAFPLEGVLLNLPVSVPVGVDMSARRGAGATSLYLVNPMMSVIVRVDQVGGAVKSEFRFEYDHDGERYAERRDADGRLTGVYHRVTTGRYIFFSDYMDLAEDGRLDFVATMDSSGDEVFKFERKRESDYEWKWLVTCFDNENGGRVKAEWYFNEGRALTLHYQYIYTGDSLDRVDRYDEDDVLNSRYFPQRKADGAIDYYVIEDLDGNIIGDTRNE